MSDTENDPKVVALIEQLRNLPSDDHRHAVTGAFCTQCGSVDPGCRCWDDS